MQHFEITGNVVDIENEEIFYGKIIVTNTKIVAIEKLAPNEKPSEHYILPGFIDSHVHIESSMLAPAEFAKLAVAHGSVGTISDPHEIANVCGVEGVKYMIENGKTVPFKFHFGAPSCVPATVFETAGAAIDAEAVAELLKSDDIFYLSEMMNFPGVLQGDDEVLKKIESAKQLNKPVDGHAPGLRGLDAKKYIAAGISTDHECYTKEEAMDKLSYGMKIIIREGSAAKNFEALIDLLNEQPDNIMFCSDDKHPDSLLAGHINQLCARAVARGINIFSVLKAACTNPVKHYKMQIGLLKESDDADFILVKSLVDFQVVKTYIKGILVAENGKSLIETTKANTINNFACSKKTVEDFKYSWNGKETIEVIEALDGQLITNKLLLKPKIENNCIVSDIENDVLKIVCINRYHDAPVALSLIKNFGLKKGALASSVAHDSHNIIAVGVDDKSICEAVNNIIQTKGGISIAIADEDRHMLLALPIAGLMSNEDGYTIAAEYTAIDAEAKKLGCTLAAPFMTLSFMALLVIPHLKLSDKGLFDADNFQFINQ